METRRYSALIPIGIVVLAFAASAVTFLVSISASNPTAAHWRAAIATAPMFLFVGAGLMFLRGLQGFTPEVQKAYRLLAWGLLAFSALLVQLVIWGITDTWDSAWATSGSGLVPFVLAAALAYVGARKFARVLEIKNVLTNLWLMVLLTALVSLGMGVLAHYFVTYTAQLVDVYIGVCSWGAAFLTCAAVLIYQASRVIGAHYRSALIWLFVGVTMFALCAWHEAINTFWFNNGSTYTDYGYYLIPWNIAGVLLVYAAFRFRQLTNYVIIPVVEAPKPSDRDYIDSIVAVAGLVSQPKEVDSVLDPFRLITANAGKGQALSPTDKQQVVQTFTQLETYLTQKDPVRTFNKEEIASRTTPAFQGILPSAKSSAGAKEVRSQ